MLQHHTKKHPDSRQVFPDGSQTTKNGGLINLFETTVILHVYISTDMYY